MPMKVVDTSVIVVGGVLGSWRSSRYTMHTVPVSGSIASCTPGSWLAAAKYMPTEPSMPSFHVG